MRTVGRLSEIILSNKKLYTTPAEYRKEYQSSRSGKPVLAKQIGTQFSVSSTKQTQMCKYLPNLFYLQYIKIRFLLCSYHPNIKRWDESSAYSGLSRLPTFLTKIVWDRLPIWEVILSRYFFRSFSFYQLLYYGIQ